MPNTKIPKPVKDSYIRVKTTAKRMDKFRRVANALEVSQTQLIERFIDNLAEPKTSPPE